MNKWEHDEKMRRRFAIEDELRARRERADEQLKRHGVDERSPEYLLVTRLLEMAWRAPDVDAAALDRAAATCSTP